MKPGTHAITTNWGTLDRARVVVPQVPGFLRTAPPGPRVLATLASGVVLAQFVESMSDKLFFTVITVTDELNAYKVFETLNARGVRLSATDLLKNYLFSVLHREGQHEHELKALENRWETMVGRLGSESFPDFLRVHWNSRFAFLRQTELFKTIRSKITTREGVFELLRAMEEDVDIYMTLTQPDASNWHPTLKEYAKELKMFSVRQPFPLLMAAHRSFTSPYFDSDSFNLEHILPENPQSGWQAFSDEDLEALVYRIANLTLLSKGANRDLGNKPFTDKKPVFAESSFVITRKVAEENADWTPERLATRQKSMATMATTIWRVAQLS